MDFFMDIHDGYPSWINPYTPHGLHG